MARKYSPSMLFAPVGELVTAMFPGKTDEQITEALQSYLDDGYTNAEDASDVDEAALAWAYARAFRTRALELAAMPASISKPNEVTTTRTDGQRGYFEGQAARWESTFEGYFADESSSGDLFPPTLSTPTVIK